MNSAPEENVGAEAVLRTDEVGDAKVIGETDADAVAAELYVLGNVATVGATAGSDTDVDTAGAVEIC